MLGAVLCCIQCWKKYENIFRLCSRCCCVKGRVTWFHLLSRRYTTASSAIGKASCHPYLEMYTRQTRRPAFVSSLPEQPTTLPSTTPSPRRRNDRLSMMKLLRFRLSSAISQFWHAVRVGQNSGRIVQHAARESYPSMKVVYSITILTHSHKHSCR